MQHFQFLVDDFGYLGPAVLDHGPTFDVRYDGDRTTVLLTWDVEGGFFACHLVPRMRNGELNPDPERWLTPNEVLAARNARHDWVGHADLEQADEVVFARTMDRHAANLRTYCADVLGGDWSIYDLAHRWLEEPANE